MSQVFFKVSLPLPSIECPALPPPRNPVLST